MQKLTESLQILSHPDSPTNPSQSPTFTYHYPHLQSLRPFFKPNPPASLGIDQQVNRRMQQAVQQFTQAETVNVYPKRNARDLKRMLATRLQALGGETEKALVAIARISRK